jgi:hypothetical protein
VTPVRLPTPEAPTKRWRKAAAILSLLLLNSAGAQQSYLVDWNDVGQQAIDHLVELVKIRSVNPPGNEDEVAEYVKAVLAAEGIESELYALDPERPNLVAKLKGNGKKKPILIMAHTDVVGVQPEKWYADPFSGIREDGFIYGRGTLDDKDNVASIWIAMSSFSPSPARRAPRRSASTSWLKSTGTSLPRSTASQRVAKASFETVMSILSASRPRKRCRGGLRSLHAEHQDMAPFHASTMR